MLWKGIYFVEIIRNNKEKYLKIDGKIPATVFKDILTSLESYMTQYWEELKVIND